MKTLGNKLKEARKNKGLTQKQLAQIIGVKHNSISNWENDQNRPDPDTIELLCGALEVTPSWLLEGYKERITLALGYRDYTNERLENERVQSLAEEESTYTLAASRIDGYGEALTEDEAIAVKAFLKAYRNMKQEKKD